MEIYLSQIINYLLMQSWQIAILVVVIAAVNLVLKNRSAHVRYLLWLIVMAKCLVPPLVTIPLAVLPQDKMPEPTVISNGEMPAVNIEMADTITSEPIEVPLLPVKSPTIMERLERVTSRQWMGFGWLAGVAVFVLFAVIKALRTEFWLKCKRKLLPAELKCEVEELFSDVGVRTFPKVWLVDGIGQPFVWGLLRGSIYLPDNFVKVNGAEHRRGVLGHELSHVLRFDAAVNFLQIIAQAVFWLHPFVWWANKKIRAEREKCCDEMAIARLGAKAKDYSAAIVDTLVTEYESARPIPSLAIAGPVKNIEERIKTMLRPGKKFYKRPSLVAVAFILLLALLAVPTVLVLTARAGTKAVSESNNKVTCTGKVIDTQGQPIAGVKVTAYELGSDGIAGNILLRQVGKVTTEEGGVFTFTTDPKPERGLFFKCKIVAVKPDLALGWAEWTMRENVESNIELGEPKTLEGMVVDEKGKPVIGAEVRANLTRRVEAAEGEEKIQWLPGIAPLHELGTRTDSHGEFILSNLPGDSGVDLLVTAQGKATTYTYRSALREPAFKTGQPPVRVVLPDEARIEGRIVDPDTGQGIARTEFAVVATSSGLFYYRFVHTTNDDGTFSVGGLQTDRYLLRNGGFPRTYVEVESGKTTNISVRADRLSRPRGVAGVVRDQEGRRLSNAVVSTYPPVSMAEEIITDARGTFTLRLGRARTPNEGTTYLLVRHKERNLAIAEQLDESAQEFDITLVPGAILSGKVVDVEGRGIPGAELSMTLRRSTSVRGSVEMIRIDKSGNYEIRAVPTGHTYRLTASAEGYGKLYRRVNIYGAANERIEIEPLVLSVANLSVSGTVVDEFDRPVSGVRISASANGQPSRGTFTDVKGKFTISNVCPGQISIHAYNRRLSGTANADGGATDIKIVVAELGKLGRPGQSPSPLGKALPDLPRWPPPLLGKALPDLKNLGVDLLPGDLGDKTVLVCFFDMQQRSARRCVIQLAQQAEELEQKGVTVVAIQASKVDEDELKEWIKKNNIPFPVGMIADGAEKTRSAWGVQALPWLILTDRNHVVSAEGFGLSELYEKIEAVAEK